VNHMHCFVEEFSNDEPAPTLGQVLVTIGMNLDDARTYQANEMGVRFSRISEWKEKSDLAGWIRFTEFILVKNRFGFLPPWLNMSPC